MNPKLSKYRQVGHLHATCINRGFLATLGEPFLALLYQAIDNDKRSVLLVEERDGEVLGFVAGGQGMGSIYKQLLRKPLVLMLALMPVLLSPKKLWRIAEILRHGSSGSSDAAIPSAELLSIAVAPHARSQGHAPRLYTRLSEHFLAQGIDSFHIVVGQDLSAAHAFYRKMGAQAKGSVTVHGADISVVYVQAITSK